MVIERMPLEKPATTTVAREASTVVSSPQEFLGPNLFVDLFQMTQQCLFLKCEGLNFAGSIKLRTAASMVDAGERSGRLQPGMTLVESSSGNLGVALSIVAADRGYRFVCVTDSRSTPTSRRLMTSLGASVEVVTEPHPQEGLLGARIRLVRSLCERPGYVWLNQYANEANWLAHYRTTAPEITQAFPDLAVLFVGAGTSGTLMGCARYLRERRLGTVVVAIDSVGSVNFGGPAATRHIPGLGTAVRPEILDVSLVDDVLHVPEQEAVRMCRRLARHGFLLGGSTGTVVSGAASWLRSHREYADRTAVAISPDLGERYLGSVYDDEWVAERWGSSALG